MSGSKLVMLREAKHLYDIDRFAFAQRSAERSFASLRMTGFVRMRFLAI